MSFESAQPCATVARDPVFTGEDVNGFLSRRSSDSMVVQTGKRRAQRACVSCRQKKIRCSGPSLTGAQDCINCRNDRSRCDWPISRRRRSANPTTAAKERRQSADTALSQQTLTARQGWFAEQSQPRTYERLSFDASIIQSPLRHSGLAPIPQSLPSLAPDSQAQAVDPVQSAISIDALLGLASLHSTPRARIFGVGEAFEAIQEVQTSPAGRPYVKLGYKRVAGNTSVHPGINRIGIKLLRGQGGSRPLNIGSPAGFASLTFDEKTGLPSIEITRHLIDLFDEKLGQHFPAIDAASLKDSLQREHVSGFLILAICAIAARYSPHVSHDPAGGGNVFMGKVQDMVIPLLRCPTLDTTAGLLLLAWSEFGQNSEAGLWQFAGMAIRMAIDLGLNKDMEVHHSPRWLRTMSEDLFWSVFLIDRITSMGMGRPTSIASDSIEIPLPNRNQSPGSVSDEPLTFYIRIMEKCGRIGDMLNGNRGTSSTFQDHLDSGLAVAEALRSHQLSLVELYNSAPPELSWSPSNFKAHCDRRQGGVFLSIHVWANAMLSLTHHPSTIHKPRGPETPITQLLENAVELSIAASRTVCECLVASALMDDEALVSSPHVVHALYFASLAFGYQIRAAMLTGGVSKNYIAQQAKHNLWTIIAAMEKMSRYWAGAGHVRNILEQRANGHRHATINFAASWDPIETFISLPDSAIPETIDDEADKSGLDQVAIDDAWNRFFSPGSQATTANANETDTSLWQTLLSSSATDTFVYEPMWYDTVLDGTNPNRQPQPHNEDRLGESSNR